MSADGKLSVPSNFKQRTSLYLNKLSIDGDGTAHVATAALGQWEEIVRPPDIDRQTATVRVEIEEYLYIGNKAGGSKKARHVGQRRGLI